MIRDLGFAILGHEDCLDTAAAWTESALDGAGELTTRQNNDCGAALRRLLGALSSPV
jgi:hypothetical protein